MKPSIAALDLPISPRPNGPRWGLFYGLEDDSPWTMAGRAVEHEVFTESLDYSTSLLHDEYDPYDHLSTWIVMANLHAGEVVGAVRALIGDRSELKLANDLKRLWDTDIDTSLAFHGVSPDVRVVECATISVLPPWRSVDSHWPVRALCSSFGLLTMDVGGEWCVQLQDISGPRLLRRVMALPFDILADLDPVDFLGPVVPSISHVAGHFTSFLPYADPDVVAFYSRQDQSVKGGTLLPAIDLRSESASLLSAVGNG